MDRKDVKHCVMDPGWVVILFYLSRRRDREIVLLLPSQSQ